MRLFEKKGVVDSARILRDHMAVLTTSELLRVNNWVIYFSVFKDEKPSVHFRLIKNRPLSLNTLLTPGLEKNKS